MAELAQAGDEHEYLMGMIRLARRSLAEINGYVNMLNEATTEGERDENTRAIWTATIRLVWASNKIIGRLGMGIPFEAVLDSEQPIA